jgi:hypothetical protein
MAIDAGCLLAVMWTAGLLPNLSQSRSLKLHYQGRPYTHSQVYQHHRVSLYSQIRISLPWLAALTIACPAAFRDTASEEAKELKIC